MTQALGEMVSSQSLKANKRVAGGFAIGSGGQVDEDVGMGGGVVLDFLDLDLALVGGGDDRIHQRAGGGAEGDLGDAQDAFFLHRNAGADADFPPRRPSR
jgi:hypothetical protein